MSSPSARSPAAPSRPAMVLVEILVAAAILAAAAALFLSVLVDARSQVAQGRTSTAGLAVAADILRTTQTRWPNVAFSGERAGYAWVLHCEPRPLIQSPRFALRRCTAIVHPKRGPDIRLTSTWAVRMGLFGQPSP
jgi:hypothetical protein